MSEFAECLECSCFAARRAARTVTQHYERHLKPSGLRVTQFTLLALLELAGPQPLSRFADQMGVERTTLTRNLRALVERGWGDGVRDRGPARADAGDHEAGHGCGPGRTPPLARGPEVDRAPTRRRRHPGAGGRVGRDRGTGPGPPVTNPG